VIVRQRNCFVSLFEERVAEGFVEEGGALGEEADGRL